MKPNFSTVVLLFLGSLLGPLAYHLIIGFDDIPTRILITPTYEVSFTVGGWTNIFTIGLLLISLITLYLYLKNHDFGPSIVIIYLITSSLMVGLTEIEIYNIFLPILIEGLLFTLFYIYVVWKRVHLRDFIVHTLLGLAYGISIGTAMSFNNMFLGFVVAGFIAIYTFIMYKVQDIIVSWIEARKRIF